MAQRKKGLPLFRDAVFLCKYLIQFFFCYRFFSSMISIYFFLLQTWKSFIIIYLSRSRLIPNSFPTKHTAQRRWRAQRSEHERHEESQEIEAQEWFFWGLMNWIFLNFPIAKIRKMVVEIRKSSDFFKKFLYIIFVIQFPRFQIFQRISFIICFSRKTIFFISARTHICTTLQP